MHQLEFTVSCEIKYFLVSKFSQGHMHELLKKNSWKIGMENRVKNSDILRNIHVHHHQQPQQQWNE